MGAGKMNAIVVDASVDQLIDRKATLVISIDTHQKKKIYIHP